MKRFRESEHLIEQERQSIILEREDLERIRTLYKTSCETVETMNKRLTDQVN